MALMDTRIHGRDTEPCRPALYITHHYVHRSEYYSFRCLIRSPECSKGIVTGCRDIVLCFVLPHCIVLVDHLGLCSYACYCSRVPVECISGSGGNTFMFRMSSSEPLHEPHFPSHIVHTHDPIIDINLSTTQWSNLCRRQVV